VAPECVRDALPDQRVRLCCYLGFGLCVTSSSLLEDLRINLGSGPERAVGQEQIRRLLNKPFGILLVKERIGPLTEGISAGHDVIGQGSLVVDSAVPQVLQQVKFILATRP
jgi:hypothetical protein